MKPTIRSQPGITPTDHTPLALAAVAITQLYREEQDWRAVYYSMKRTELLSAAATGQFLPQPTDLQQKLNDLIGGVSEAHLYLPRYEHDEPTHYVSIIRDPDTQLWRLRHTKVRAVADRKSFGAMIYWKQITPIPDVCIELTPALTPVIKGAGAYDAFVSAVTGHDLATQQQLSHSIIVSKLFGATTTHRSPIWFSNARNQFTENCTRVSFLVDENTDGWTLPFAFGAPAIRKGLPFSTKKNVSIIHTDKGIFPFTSKLLPVEPHKLGDLSFVLEQLLIAARLTPFVGVTLDGQTVQLYTAFYYLDTETPEIVQIAKGRRMSNCESIPVIKPWQNYNGYWIPTLPLTAILHYYTLLDDRAARVMPYFGASKITSYNKIFGRYGMPLAAEELEKLDSNTGIITSSNIVQPEV